MSEVTRRAKKQKLLVELSKMPIVEVACKRVGIGRATYYRWYKDDDSFAEAADTAIAESTGRIDDLAESQLITAIKNGNMTGIIFWLKHHKEIYGDHIRLKRLEAELMTYKNKPDDGFKILRQIAEDARVIAAKYAASDEYKKEQEEYMRRASGGK